MDHQTERTPIPIAIIAGQLVVGGAERQLYLWLANLDRRRFDPVVVTLHPGCGDYWESLIESLSIPVLGVSRRSIRLVRSLEIVHVLRPYRPRLVHGWHLFASPYAAVAAKLLGAKSLGSLRSSFRSFQNKYLESSLTLMLADSLLTNSHSAGEQLKRFQVSKKMDIHVVVNAVEDKVGDRLILRQKLNQQFGISSGQLLIGSLGRLDANKRYDLLLKVMSILQEGAEDFHFLLIGDGPDRPRLEKMAQSLGLSRRVTFTGEIPAASAWLSALDIFCFASLDEGLPNVIMEAAAASVPIVSWHTPFIEELLDNGRVGMLVAPPGNIINFRDMLLNLMHSPQLRMEVGKAAHDHILGKFPIDRFVGEMTSVYENLLNGKPKARKA